MGHVTTQNNVTLLRNSISLERHQFFLGTQAFTSPTDMASFGVWLLHQPFVVIPSAICHNFISKNVGFIIH